MNLTKDGKISATFLVTQKFIPVNRTLFLFFLIFFYFFFFWFVRISGFFLEFCAPKILLAPLKVSTPRGWFFRGEMFSKVIALVEPYNISENTFSKF